MIEIHLENNENSDMWSKSNWLEKIEKHLGTSWN